MNSLSNRSQLSDQISKEAAGRAIGRIATGVYVITLKRDGQFDGMLTSWICQASFEPPMLTVAVKKERPIFASLQVGSDFVVNVLSKNNMQIFKNFARPYSEDFDRFAGLKLDQNSKSAPIFSDCIAYMICTVQQIVESGDHHLLIAEILQGSAINPEDEPMVHLRKSGFQY